MPPSRTVAPYSPPRTFLPPRAVPRHGRHPAPFIPAINPLERVNREIGRRADVVGIFLNDASAIRLTGALLIEQDDEWLVSRRYLSEESLALLADDAYDAAGRARKNCSKPFGFRTATTYYYYYYYITDERYTTSDDLTVTDSRFLVGDGTEYDEVGRSRPVRRAARAE